MGKAAKVIASLFLAYLAISLLSNGWTKHANDGGSHADLIIGGLVFGIIAVAGFASALEFIPSRRRPN